MLRAIQILPIPLLPRYHGATQAPGSTLSPWATLLPPMQRRFYQSGIGNARDRGGHNLHLAPTTHGVPPAANPPSTDVLDLKTMMADFHRQMVQQMSSISAHMIARETVAPSSASSNNTAGLPYGLPSYGGIPAATTYRLHIYPTHTYPPDSISTIPIAHPHHDHHTASHVICHHGLPRFRHATTSP